MDDLFRLWRDPGGRVGGPMHCRLLLQPAMALVFSIRDGLKDVRSGRPNYFWTLFTDPASRGELLREGWKAVGRIFFLALVMDFTYQLIVFQWFYPIPALILAGLLAFLPYLLGRGLVNRIARLRRHHQPESTQAPGGA